MAKRLVFQTNKQDYSVSRTVECEEPDLSNGQVRVKLDRFAFTANNITYAVLGERMHYWAFFPVNEIDQQNWGVIPVWGYADVIESKEQNLPVGDRLFGYFPPASTLVMTPSNVSPDRFIEASEHRKTLPIGYNLYQRVLADNGYEQSQDNERMVFTPLFVTAYCLHNMLSTKDWYGAQQIVIISASSKTSVGLGYALVGDVRAPKTIGLTSRRNLDALQSFGVYDEVTSYEAIEELDSSKATVIVDMSGNAEVLARLHRHLGQNMCFTSNVGITHWRNLAPVSGIIADRSQMFFVPAHIQSLIESLGIVEYQKQTSEFIETISKKIRPWMKFKEVAGLSGLQDVYGDVCGGKVEPNISLSIKL